MRLYLVRHGETESNNKKIVQGQADTHLNEVGRQQARNLARILNDRSIAKIYSSDLSRARETAEIINEHLKVPMKLTPELRELDMGNWEGRSFLELQKTPDFGDWVVTPTKFDKVRGGERLDELKDRIKNFLDKIKNDKEENILIVTHGIALTTFILVVLNASMDNIWRLRVNNASLSIIKYLDSFDTWVIEKFNDFNHNVEYFERDVYNF